MKLLKFLLGCLVVTGLASCIDTEEKIVINADQTGMYTITLDMGRLLEMAANMGGAQSKSDKPKEKKDTTIYLKDLLNSDPEVTAAEKETYKDGKLYVNLDEAANKMMIVGSCPFKNAAGLTEVKNNFFLVLKKLKALEKMAGPKDNEAKEADDGDMAMKSSNPVGDKLTFVATPHSITNTIADAGAVKEQLAADSTMKMLSSMAGMMGDFNYTTIIILPKPIKKYEGPGSEVSADKKTVKFVSTLTSIMEAPDKTSYKIEY